MAWFAQTQKDLASIWILKDLIIVPKDEIFTSHSHNIKASHYPVFLRWRKITVSSWNYWYSPSTQHSRRAHHKCWSNSVKVCGGASDKRTITVTLSESLDCCMLPFHLIYTGKTERSSPDFTFPDRFFLVFNQKHWSNETETMRLLEYLLVPYIKKVK